MVSIATGGRDLHLSKQLGGGQQNVFAWATKTFKYLVKVIQGQRHPI